MTATRPTISHQQRFEVFKRDLFTCQYCGRFAPHVTLEVDHIVPLSSGGEHDETNFITSCRDCNRGKGGIPLQDSAKSHRARLRALKPHRSELTHVRLPGGAEVKIPNWNLPLGRYYQHIAQRRSQIAQLEHELTIMECAYSLRYHYPAAKTVNEAIEMVKADNA